MEVNQGFGGVGRARALLSANCAREGERDDAHGEPASGYDGHGGRKENKLGGGAVCAL